MVCQLSGSKSGRCEEEAGGGLDGRTPLGASGTSGSLIRQACGVVDGKGRRNATAGPSKWSEGPRAGEGLATLWCLFCLWIGGGTFIILKIFLKHLPGDRSGTGEKLGDPQIVPQLRIQAV